MSGRSDLVGHLMHCWIQVYVHARDRTLTPRSKLSQLVPALPGQSRPSLLSPMRQHYGVTTLTGWSLWIPGECFGSQKFMLVPLKDCIRVMFRKLTASLFPGLLVRFSG